jgi:DNA modification methylase
LSTAHAERGAALYATVPSGTLLPHFIASIGDVGFTFKNSLVWVKNSMVLGRSDYHYCHETVLYAWIENGRHYFISDRTQDSVFEINRPAASPFHPTTKPIQLVARMLTNSSRKGDLIFDPFCGSGTTMLAAVQLGRKCFAVELDPRYVAVALERLSSLGLKAKLLEKKINKIID